MSAKLLECILNILDADTPEAYLALQEAAANVAQSHYADLCYLALHHQSHLVRAESLKLAFMVDASDIRELLLNANTTDPHDAIITLSKALLMRRNTIDIVAKSGKLDPKGLETFKERLRYLSARALYGLPIEEKETSAT